MANIIKKGIAKIKTIVQADNAKLFTSKVHGLYDYSAADKMLDEHILPQLKKWFPDATIAADALYYVASVKSPEEEKSYRPEEAYKSNIMEAKRILDSYSLNYVIGDEKVFVEEKGIRVPITKLHILMGENEVDANPEAAHFLQRAGIIAKVKSLKQEKKVLNNNYYQGLLKGR